MPSAAIASCCYPEKFGTNVCSMCLSIHDVDVLPDSEAVLYCSLTRFGGGRTITVSGCPDTVPYHVLYRRELMHGSWVRIIYLRFSALLKISGSWLLKQAWFLIIPTIQCYDKRVRSDLCYVIEFVTMIL